VNAARSARWLRLSTAAAVLASVGSVVGLTVSRIYAHEVSDFRSQALAQDATNLLVAAPALFLLALFALRGSVRAYLAWLGVLAFTVYNYAIYVFSVHFGPLFLLWVVVFGSCFYALAGGIAAIDSAAIKSRLRDTPRVPITAWVLFVLAGLFALTWLKEIVPDMWHGGIPVIATPIVDAIRGDTGTWRTAALFAPLSAATLTLLVLLLRSFAPTNLVDTRPGLSTIGQRSLGTPARPGAT
jgi:hypothetical protein